MSDKEKTAIAEKVKAEFMHSWKGYKKYAMGHDELKPLSKSFRDWHASSLLMTPVDALDVLYIMGFKKEADSTKEYIIRNLSFDHDIFVKNFEITIRILYVPKLLSRLIIFIILPKTPDIWKWETLSWKISFYTAELMQDSAQ
jgi:Glycosyl hydrolase family 47